ncbi:MAG: DNA polymerase I [Actinomycetota bacterium]
MTSSTPSASKTLLVLDGHSLTYRAFFGLPTDMVTASGQVTNAVFGFTSMLLNILKERRPAGIVVAFDRSEPTFRHIAEPSYKAQREESPDILRQQVGIVREVLQAMGITTVDVVGFEADDVIATLADRAVDHGFEVIVVTGDRDSFQLVRDPHVRVLYNRRGVSDYVLYDEAGIFERTGVTAAQYPAYAALRGDPSDNLPGVPGVGEKTAAKLISTYGGLEGIFANVESQTPKLKASLVENQERARRNEELMTLRHDAPVDIEIDDLRPKPNNADVRRLFDFLEFKSMHARFRDAMAALGITIEEGGASGSGPLEVRNMSTTSDVGQILGMLTPLETLDVAAAWSGEPGRSALEGVSIVIDSASMHTLWLSTDLLQVSEIRSFIETAKFRSHEGKPLLRALLDFGIDPDGLELDTAIAEYLIDPGQNHYSLGDIVAKHSDTYFANDAARTGQLDLDSTQLGSREVSARDALAVCLVADKLKAALEAQGMLDLYNTVENPLVRVLARMEHLGIGVDIAELRTIAERLTNRASELSETIQTLAGHPFNPNSPTQLAKILFEERGLTPPKKTKTGFSTDAATLEKLREEWPDFIEPLLEYREVEKLRGTYGEGLLAEVAADGRIHATFNQTVARTGRLSSDRPNLHNIPVRTEEGRVFRTAFVPRAGCEFLVADYNQIELRCIAHLADDPGLIAAFTDGRDVHNATASRVFGVDETKVSVEQRSKAKMVSYGLAYGMEAYGLGQRLGIPTDEAGAILDSYFAAFPNVHAYMERTVAEAKARGYTETLFGRRRRIPELDSPNFRIRQAGERQAMNAGIQGLAADIFKIALIDIDTSLDRAGLESRLVLQVHDEVIVEVPSAEKETVGPLVLGCMQNAAELKVPLAVNFAWGKSWAEAKS